MAENKKRFRSECSNCEKKLFHETQSGLCQDCFNSMRREETLKKWLETGDTGCSVKTTIRNAVRDYIYEKQDNKCAICGTDRIWNGKQLNFVLDHIDGDASNNYEINLRLVCPNCDSQLDTFKSKNKKSARSHR